MMNKNRFNLRLAAASALLILAGLLSGCGIAPAGSGNGSVTGNGAVLGAAMGRVQGGQQPVTGALIQLYAVGNNGSKSAATPLIAQTVRTGVDGGFNITGQWNCTDNTATYGTNPLLYLVATGGNPGLASGTDNQAIAMMAALGPCNSIGAQTFIFVDEVTTVASVYALAPFMSDYAHIGAPMAKMSALANAFGTVSALANTTTGMSPGPNVVAGESVPTTTINALANSIASCINSDGTGTGSCPTLFVATKPTVGNAATDTIGAVLQIATSPAQNVTTIYHLATPSAPFSPSVSSTPADWTMMLKFTGGGLSGPAGIAIDAAGNAWVANASGGSVTGMSSQGTLLTGATGYDGGGTIFGAQGIAVDTAGNVWLADTLLSTVFKLTVVNGAVQGSAAFTNAVSGPTGIAIDGQNDVWVANFGDGSVTELSNAGVPMGGSPLTANGTLQGPAGIAIDAAGNAWVTDNTASIVVKFDKSQALLSGSGFTDNALLGPAGIAIDSLGRSFVAGNGNGAVSLLGANGTSTVATPFMGGGITMPTAVAVDGSGSAWVSNGVSAGSLTLVHPGIGSPVGGFGMLNAPAGIAIDASGNVWTANAGDDSVSKFVGLATPVTPPLAVTVGP